MFSIDDIIKKGLEQQAFIDDWFKDPTIIQEEEEKEPIVEEIVTNLESPFEPSLIQLSWVDHIKEEEEKHGIPNHTIYDIFRFDLELQDRIHSFSQFCQQQHLEDDYDDKMFEIISKLLNIYTLSSITHIQQFLEWVCMYELIPITFRIECCLAIRDFGKRTLGYDLLYQLPIENEHYIIQVKHYCDLLNESEKYKSVLNRLETILQNSSIPSQHRYNIISKCSLHNIEYTKQLGFTFLHIQEDNDMRKYQIMYCVFFITIVEPEEIYQYLLHIGNDTCLNEDIRAEALDTLYHIGSDVIKEKTQKLLLDMGGKGKTIYENTQNAHFSSIYQSAINIIKDLLDVLSKERIDMIPYEEIVVELTRIRPELHEPLNRISMDPILFDEIQMSLSSILSVIYTYIQIQEHKEHKEEMMKRLIEELTETSEKCTTGYFNRMVNSLSGFNNIHIRISWEDQIIATFISRFNQLIINSKHADDILEEMTESFDKQRHIRELHQQALSTLRQEMYEEYCPYISDVDFDTFFGKAYIEYNK